MNCRARHSGGHRKRFRHPIYAADTPTGPESAEFVSRSSHSPAAKKRLACRSGVSGIVFRTIVKDKLGTTGWDLAAVSDKSQRVRRKYQLKFVLSSAGVKRNPFDQAL
jgi:hypothetical protein